MVYLYKRVFGAQCHISPSIPLCCSSPECCGSGTDLARVWPRAVKPSDVCNAAPHSFIVYHHMCVCVCVCVYVFVCVLLVVGSIQTWQASLRIATLMFADYREALVEQALQI